LLILPCRSFALITDVDFDRGHFIVTAAGPIGIGDKVESVEPAGVVYVSPGRNRTVSHVYLGNAIDFYLPGRADLWLWIGPILSITPLIFFYFLPSISKKKALALRILLFAVCGFYYGVILLFLSGLFGGNWNYWADIMGSPFSFMGPRLGCLFWILIAVLLALASHKWAGWGLAMCVCFHYLGIIELLSWFSSSGWHIFDGTDYLLTKLPVWVISWGLIYAIGQWAIWNVLISKCHQRFHQ
jgi:hypothetical protein